MTRIMNRINKMIRFMLYSIICCKEEQIFYERVFESPISELKIKIVFFFFGILIVLTLLSIFVLNPFKPTPIKKQWRPPVYAGSWASDFNFVHVSKMVQTPTGDFYVLDRGSAKIYLFTPDGTPFHEWDKLTLHFDGPHPPYQGNDTNLAEDIAVDSDSNVYVVINGMLGHQIQKYNSEGQLIRFSSLKLKDLTSGKSFLMPYSIAVDSRGNIFVTDLNSHSISKFDSEGNPLKKWGGPGNKPGKFSFGMGMESDRMVVDNSGNLYVCDTTNNRIQKFDNDGNYILHFSSVDSGPEQIRRPSGIAIGPDGNINVVYEYAHKIQVFSTEGIWLRAWGEKGKGDGQLEYPRALAFDKEGKAYVISHDNKIQIFVPARSDL